MQYEFHIACITYVREVSSQVAWVCWVEPLPWFYVCENMVIVVVMVRVVLCISSLVIVAVCQFVDLLFRCCWRVHVIRITSTA